MTVIAARWSSDLGVAALAADTGMFDGADLVFPTRRKLWRFDVTGVTLERDDTILLGYAGHAFYDHYLEDVVQTADSEDKLKAQGHLGWLKWLMKDLSAWAKEKGHGEVRDGIFTIPGFIGIAVSNQGVFSLDPDLVCKIETPFYAIGAGGQLALGALANGASAVEAVEIACRFHAHCSDRDGILLERA